MHVRYKERKYTKFQLCIVVCDSYKEIIIKVFSSNIELVRTKNNERLGPLDGSALAV